jgi:ABC-type proline/glycine betaine transport system substrate-binding protein
MISDDGMRISDLKSRITAAILAGAMLFALCAAAEAQQSANIPRIAYMTASSSALRLEAFRQGLRELGYVEGKNILVDFRLAEGKLERLPRLAAELQAGTSLACPPIQPS